MFGTLSIRLGAVALAAALLLGAPIAAAQTPPAPKQAAYTYSDQLPAEIPGVGFEMPKQAFMDALAAKKLTPTTNEAKTMFLVQPAGAPYNNVVYFFNSPAGEILTEIEIRFASEAQAKAYFDAKYRKDYGYADYIKSDGISAYKVKAWSFQNKVFVVAMMANTRWEGKDHP
ncbi:MAG TPA: hypothetical protein VG942_13615 [Hyphomonadaceae bacterium]|nr:hypothetical protein [Hyphomonadaceae bacterium]